MKISFCKSGSGVALFLRDYLFEFMHEQGLNVHWLPGRFNLADLGDIMFSVNFLPDIARLARDIRKPYVAWLTSSWVNPRLNDPTCVSDYAIQLHFSRIELEKCRRLGYRQLFYLPRPVDHRPYLRMDPQAPQKYPIVFLGNCYVPEESSDFRPYRAAYLQAGRPAEKGLATLEAFIEAAAMDLTTPLWILFTRFIGERHPQFFQECPLPTTALGPHAGVYEAVAYITDVLLGHEIDFHLRSRLIRRLAPLDMHLWGKADGWRPFVGNGVTFHGYAEGAAAMAGIMAAARIALNLPRRYTDGVIMRTFEIPACATMQLSLYIEDYAAMFEEDREIVFFRSLDEAHDKARFYLEHDEPRIRIARAGRERLLRDHTMAQRFETLRTILHGIGLDI